MSAVADKLIRKLRSERSRVIQAGYPADEMLDRVNAAELAVLFAFESRLPRDRIEVPELLFDRLLLKLSVHYRRTRRRARTAGIELMPSIRSLKRVLREFDPTKDTVFYGPMRTPLRERLKSNPLKTQELMKYNYPVYHELNHGIAVKHFPPPSGLSARERSRFWSVQETIAILRDIQLAEELGPLGGPLQRFGSLFRSRLKGVAPKFDYDRFRRLFLYVLLRMNSVSDPTARKLLRQHVGSIDRETPARVSGGFLKKTVPAWLGSRAGGLGSRRVRGPTLEYADPMMLLRDPAKLRPLYRWYVRVFG